MSASHPVLEEIVREAESVLDRQLQGIEQADGKFERLIALATTALGGMIAVAFFTVQHFSHSLGFWSTIVFLSGVVLTLASIASFLAGYIGVKHHADIAIGPEVAWLEQKAQNPGWDLTEHYVTLVAGFKRFVHANYRTMEKKARRRTWGAWLLAGSVALVTVSVGLLLWTSLTA